MLINDTVRRAGARLASKRDAGAVISSRARLARNLRNAAFPEWSGEEESARLCLELRRVFGTIPSLNDSVFVEMESLDPVDKEVLKEKHLISNELAEKGKGSGVLVQDSDGVAIMVNEEDHLRIQIMAPGMDLAGVADRADRLDTEIENRVEYAFDVSLGYLTACPSNVGTGLRASVMMDLTGLKLTGEVDGVLKALNRLGFAVRGLLGEGTEAFGNMFQVSNQSTLGQKEKDIAGGLDRIVSEVVMHEENARARLLEKRRSLLNDQFGRAYGILTNAHVLSSKEAMDLISVLRLGLGYGSVRNVSGSRLNEMAALAQPGHLQKFAGKAMSPQDRDEFRASVVKQRLKDISIVEL